LTGGRTAALISLSDGTPRMAHTSDIAELSASPDRVWQLIGGFHSLPDWLPYIASSVMSEGGRVRTLTSEANERIVERLESFDNAKRTYSYSFIESPFPATDYLATLSVRQAADPLRSIVEWSGRFEPVGVTDRDVITLFNGIYRTGLDALRRVFP
jgi:hypothetical protein